MALDSINIGNTPNDGTGDTLRTAFEKINNNFAALGVISGTGATSITAASTLVLRDSSGDIYSNKSFFKNTFSNLAGLPPAGDYPGMFVYVDQVGAYFSNGNLWKPLINYNASGTVTDGVLRWDGSEFAAGDPGVKTINSMSGDVVLTSTDIFTIMGYVPLGNNNQFPGDILTFSGNGAIKLPAGLTAQRPGVVVSTTAVPGMMRYNNQLDCIEAFIGPSGSAAWQTIGPLGSAPATFTSATVGTLSATAVNATNVTASAGINGALGTVTPATATVTALASSGAVTITSNTPTVSAGTGALVVTGGASIGNNVYVGGTVTVSSTTESSSVSTGALAVAGGTGIAKKLFVGGITTVTSTEQSSSTATGALVTAGGAGIAKNAYVGGILSVAGATVLAGTLTVTDDVTLSKLSASSLVFTDSSKKLISTGSITVSQGGTGFNSYTLGDILYANGTTSLAILAGNATTTKKFLTQTGTGTASAAPAWATIAESDLSTALFKEYPTGVASPTVIQTASNSIHGFNAYSSTDFPGDFYVGWTVKSNTVGAQLAINWNVEEIGSATKVYVRANDDTGTTTTWSSWERVITSTAPDANLSINSLTSAGYIQPSSGSGSNGIMFPANPGGGSGDAAKIQYYVTSSEQTELLLSVSNDIDDNIRLSASGNVIIDNTLDTTQHRNTFNNYSTTIAGGSTVAFDCAVTGDTIYISGSVSGAWTANLINLRLSADKFKTFRFIINQGVTPYIPTVQIASVAATINWIGGSAPGGTASKFDLVRLEILCTAANTYTILGQLTAFG